MLCKQVREGLSQTTKENQCLFLEWGIYLSNRHGEELTDGCDERGAILKNDSLCFVLLLTGELHTFIITDESPDKVGHGSYNLSLQLDILLSSHSLEQDWHELLVVLELEVRALVITQSSQSCQGLESHPWMLVQNAW